MASGKASKQGHAHAAVLQKSAAMFMLKHLQEWLQSMAEQRHVHGFVHWLLPLARGATGTLHDTKMTDGYISQL